MHFFYIENDAEIFPAHYTCKVAEIGFKMNKLAMINSLEIIPNFFLPKTIVKFRSALYSYAHYTQKNMVLFGLKLISLFNFIIVSIFYYPKIV